MPIIQSIERALQILDLFDEQTSELRITDISRMMNLHKSTVHSLLKTLQVHRYIDQDAESDKYRLGMKLFERGNLLLQSIDIRTVARKHLLDLASQTGQTVNLVILDRSEGVYIDKVEGEKAVIRYSRIGRRIPLHSSAVGKVLAAFRSSSELNALLDGYEFVGQTPKTITDRVAFELELDNVKRDGWAVDNEENESGVRCVSVPVRDHQAQTAGAISVSTLLSAVNDEQLQQIVKQLSDTADRISVELGYIKSK
ncbi:Transcriptional regulator KdgR [compost metagenome]